MALEKQKAHNKELEKLKEEADTANNTKSKFLANMTHELRTPLHGILNLAEFAMRKLADDEFLPFEIALQKNTAETLIAVRNGYVV